MECAPRGDLHGFARLRSDGRRRVQGVTNPIVLSAEQARQE